MEDLIHQAFLHVEVIGPHVARGHYDLVGPNGEIILPQIWETIIDPDWAITMHMSPLPKKETGPSDGVTVTDVDPAQPPLPRRRDHPIGVRQGPPPPPPGWI